MNEPVARPKYRLYVDEVGNHDLDVADVESERYLSLTGVMFDLEYVGAVVAPALDALKARYFRSHPDHPVTLHRKELLQGKYPFQALRDPETRLAFNADLIGLVNDLEYLVITATLDKIAHVKAYGGWAYHPYHYAMQVVLERYVLELHGRHEVGDVMAEGRGTREDRALKEVFRRLAEHHYAQAIPFRQRLTSVELKVKRKSDNIPGLQVADLVAHPAFRVSRCLRDKVAVPATFGGQVGEILLRTKFRRSAGGTIGAYGVKWLP